MILFNDNEIVLKTRRCIKITKRFRKRFSKKIVGSKESKEQKEIKENFYALQSIKKHY